MSLPSRSPAAPPSLPISGPLLRALFSPQSRPFWATRFFGTPPQSTPRSFAAPLENTFHSPQGFPVSFLHILWGFCTPNSWGLASSEPPFPLGFPSSGYSPYPLGAPRSLGVFLLGTPPVCPQLPDFRSPSLLSPGLSPVAVSPCSISGLRASPLFGIGVPCFALPAPLCRDICFGGLTTLCLLR